MIMNHVELSDNSIDEITEMNLRNLYKCACRDYHSLKNKEDLKDCEQEDLVFYEGIRDSLADVIRYLNVPDDPKIEAYLAEHY